ncbi:DUF551 domain-containing protein [Klebsiella pneumoniae]|uniref:DUF551 domain-containing protein n=1 Tax=Klebsiella pneumoniae TaxID=573 RepID=UPI00223179B2|nr:DUF551 domain-containing protein [Klebsiella pneumoniae]MDM9046598.1 DUF551 domain-containing protein [Klebsiella pneumoniae]
MTKSTITREQLLEIIETDHVQCGEASYLASMALAAMDSESECLPLNYLQGHKDGLEWAAQLAEANHPETGDWLYDDPIELAKAIRKGPDMPPAQPAADSEPDRKERKLFCSTDTARMRKAITVSAGTDVAQLYRHAQQPVVPEEATSDSIEILASARRRDHAVFQWGEDQRNAAADSWNACRATMLQAFPVCTCPSGDGSLRRPCPVHPGNSPTQSDCCPAQNSVTPAQNQGWIPVSEQMPEVGDIVLTAMGGVVNVGETECSAANCRFFTSVISGRELPATHWMQLPAAPQEVGDA